MKNMRSIVICLFLPHRNECVKGVKKTTAVRVATASGSFPNANSSLSQISHLKKWQVFFSDLQFELEPPVLTGCSFVFNFSLPLIKNTSSALGTGQIEAQFEGLLT